MIATTISNQIKKLSYTYIGYKKVDINIDIKKVIIRNRFIVSGILEIISKLTNRDDFKFLSHYISCNGSIMQLKKLNVEKIKETYKQTTLVSVLGVLNAPEECILKVENNKEIFNSIGKFKVIKEDSNLFRIEDEYKFYPNCEETETHFSDCGCKNKFYPNFERELKLPEFISKHIAFSLTFIFNREFEIRLDSNCVHIQTTDEFFSKLGKEFKVVSYFTM